MKLHANTHNVSSSNVVENNQFTIEASAKAFMILSDGLYSNKILAVVRELSTNAYDAHVEAGCPDAPFDVHLPTSFAPHFEVRDYGVSMTHEQCMTLYTTYFRSTKNDSNDAVGCLGLGSKAPFAYADSFTVEAYLDGEKRVYAAHRGDDGSPNFALLNVSETSEPNGIKVSLPVKPDDFAKFEHEARQVYTYFKTRPNIKGGSVGMSINSPEVLLSGRNWEIVSSGGVPVAVMGQVAYKFSDDDIRESGLSDKIADFVEETNGLVLHVNIGDLDITPSRESLSFNPQTKAKLRSIVEDMADDLVKNLQNEINHEPNLYEARVKYVTLTEQSRSISAACAALDNVTYNGEKLFDKIIHHIVPITTTVRSMSLSRYGRDRSNMKEAKTMRVGKALYFVADVKGSITRFRNKCKELQNAYHTFESVAYLIDPSDLDQVCKDLGDMPSDHASLKLCSDLPKPERSSSNSGYSISGEVSMIELDGIRADVTRRTISMKETVYYVVGSRGRFHEGRMFGTYDMGYFFAKRLRALHDAGCFRASSKVVLLTPSFIKTRKIEGRKNFIKIDRNMIMREIEQLMPTLKRHVNMKSLMRVKNITMLKVLRDVDGAIESLPLVTQGIISMANDTTQDQLLSDAAIDAIRYAGGTIPEATDGEESVKSAMWAKFPMLELVQNPSNAEQKATLHEYVKMCLTK